MNHAISTVSSSEAEYYRAIDADESARRAHDQMQDRLRDNLTWRQLEEVMGNASPSQRKAFWTEVLSLIDVEPRFMCKKNVSLLAEPLQDALAIDLDAKATEALKQ
ncbi:conserved protein of unknown function [Pseudomonas marincola]|uniref:Uncharacterized protein n=1 Tax=Pseudomonas marincola TaxID=437900 RepID=A0A653E638_9PSED|nr:hypothetical protein [Pseudomonas marincola]CAE6906109.1 conserved protein of unknown function [Pseudomonas marincola]